MIDSSRPSIQIDLNELKLHLHLKNKAQLTLHFNSPSRSFYLSVIALVVIEMRKLGRIGPISLQEHLELLILLNESIGDAAGSSGKENLLSRIYRKWKDALSNLEEAPLFKVLGKRKEEGEGAIGKIYSFSDAEKDGWANLFEYVGSYENVRLKFAIDKIGVSLNEVSVIFGDSLNEDAWDQFISRLKREQKEESVEAASVDRMKYPLPDIPSIAVLPFTNISSDPEQEYFSDGITEEIITALSKVPNLFVIACHSTLTYKGKAVKLKQISEELGVRYVLEGSVRKIGNKVRITAQLVEALSGLHLWAERYERDLKDIFALQDEITMKVLTAAQVKLTAGEQAIGIEKYFRGTQGLNCYLKYLEAAKYRDQHNIEDTRVARRIAEEALTMCPENPMAYYLMAQVYQMEYWVGSGKSPQESIEKGVEMAQKALAMDDSIAYAHALLGNFYMVKREYEKAVAEGERALAFDPGGARAYDLYAQTLHKSGRFKEAIEMFQKAIRLSPLGSPSIFVNFGHSLRETGRFEEAVSAYKKALRLAPNLIFAHLGLAAVFIMMGQDKEARDEAAEVLKINPMFSLDLFGKTLAFKDQSQTDKIINALRKAGLK